MSGDLCAAAESGLPPQFNGSVIYDEAGLTTLEMRQKTVNKKIVIVSALRTPFDKYGGVTKDIRSIELGAAVLKNVVERVDFPKDKVDYIFYGTTIHAEIALDVNVPVRQALLHAGFPSTTLSLTVDRACCASMAAFTEAVREIQAGEAEVVIAAGAENLSHVPFLLDGARWGNRLGKMELQDVNAGFNYPGFGLVSVDTESVAAREGISREDMDRWSYRTQMRYQEANKAGKFNEEIVPLPVHTQKGDVVLAEDQSPRADTTYEKLASLKAVYGTKTITAGNAPALNSGASAILMMTREKAEEYGLKPLAYVKDAVAVASDYENIPTVPALAIKKLLKRNQMNPRDLDLIEINEAFAAMPLVSTKLVADGDPELTEALRDITNVNGGAVAIGHPMGATGCRLIMTLMYELRRRGGGTGIACLCGGLAQGDGVMIEVPGDNVN